MLIAITHHKLKTECELTQISDINFFQILTLLLAIIFLNCGYSLQATEENDLELTLCHLVRNTPNYIIYGLEQKSNCLAHVTTYGSDIICLRNNENQVNKTLHI